MKTEDYLALTAGDQQQQNFWPMAAIYDRDLMLGGLVSALERHGSEALHLSDAAYFTGFAKDHAIDVAIVRCDGRDVAALRICDEIRTSTRGFFLPVILLIPDDDEMIASFARSSSADLVLSSSETPEFIATRAIELLEHPRVRGPWTIFGWMAVNSRDKKAASSGQAIAMQPVPFELYQMMLENPLDTHSLEDFANRLTETGVGKCQPSNISNVLTTVRRAFEQKGELFPLRTIYRKGYRLELGIRRNPERYSRKPRSRLFVGSLPQHG